MKEVMIKVENITKSYKIYDRNIDRLLELLPGVKERHRNFYALNNIDFEIAKGEIVGIVGQNGAGKSTLLKIITGVSSYDKGNLTVNGKIASLLELGTGFDPELTGIENIYFQGHLMGFTEKEIDDKVQEITDFADIGEFVYQPVKNYSSGMFARLAFSTAINVDPDILLVDEVLSVGDLRFQLKCLQKIEQLGAAGKTILFVSHDTHSISRYCNRVIWIKDREKYMDGLPGDVIPKYRDFMIFAEAKKTEGQSQLDTQKLVQANQWIDLSNNKEYIGDGRIKVNKIKINTKDGTVLDHKAETFTVDLELVNTDESIQDIFVSTLIMNKNSFPIAHQGKSVKEKLPVNQKIILNITFDMLPFKNGEYALTIDIGDITSGDFELCSKLNNVYIFSVFENNELYDGDGVMRFDGYSAQLKGE